MEQGCEPWMFELWISVGAAAGALAIIAARYFNAPALINAAPDLLEAARAIVDKWFDDKQPPNAPDINRLAEAIAKAEGANDGA